MAIYINNTKIDKISLESIGIKEAYAGSDCVYRTEIRLPKIYFADFNQTSDQELTDASLISIQDYDHMAHSSGTAMTIGVSMPSGASGVYTYNIAIWFDCVKTRGNVHLTGDEQYQCSYHTGRYGEHNLNSSVAGGISEIEHSGESGISYGDGYCRLYISNITLDIADGSTPAVFLELDLIQYYVDPDGETTEAAVHANRYLQLSYIDNNVPTTLNEFISGIRVTLVER